MLLTPVTAQTPLHRMRDFLRRAANDHQQEICEMRHLHRVTPVRDAFALIRSDRRLRLVQVVSSETRSGEYWNDLQN
ncbi:MAG: hypothetical protein HZA66_16130 [Rhodopseudomonas palustris]|uniref:Uncharacterized protein n=1 Tax=Rhodopseudomonas palustris TaxID=1076 RepID=A0A933VVH8_RHOPL|nr:hypothetical protein [Rhodopseudomonas palustris]